jgi:hypothetical protein
MMFANYNDMTHTLNQIGDELVLIMATLPHNFIILPGSTVQGKILLLLDHCFIVSETTGERPILVGVNGNQKSSPYKAFDPNDATVSLISPRAVAPPPGVSTQSTSLESNDSQASKTSIPTLQQFLEVDYGNAFNGLTGIGSGEKVETLVEWLASFFFHPEIPS